MKIIDGHPIEGKAWRVLVLLTPGQELDITWALGHHLGRVNGQLVTAVLLKEATEPALSRARELLAQAVAACHSQLTHYTLLIEARDRSQALARLVQEADIDLILMRADIESWINLNHLSCHVGVVRGQAYSQAGMVAHPESGALTPAPLNRILVPTAGGPNTLDAFHVLLPLANRTQITALYVATDYDGPQAEAIGMARLRQMLQLADASDRISPKVVTASSTISGIVEEANNNYDLVIMGASRESSIDKALFGNVVDTVVRQSKKPVVVIRQGSNRLANLGNQLAWGLQRVFARKTLSERVQIYTRIRRSARPDTDFFTLITLSAGIAALGLLLNSPAIIIGAMLVAPLMSPILGTGMAIVMGDARFLRLSVGAVLHGTFWAVVVGFLVGLLRPETPLTIEVLSRTAPTLLDLGVALLAGMAGAYALCESDAAGALPGVAIAAALVPPLASAGIALANALFTDAPYSLGLGALLLFSTNFIAITSAAILVFLSLGFRPSVVQKERRSLQTRTVRLALALLTIIAVLLGSITYGLAQTTANETQIRQVTAQRVGEIPGAELVDVTIGSAENQLLSLAIVARSTRPISYSAVVQLQQTIGTDLQREVALELTVIDITKLDPFIPPTHTSTPTTTNTTTPGPTPTATASLTPTPTATAMQSATATATPSPTSTNTTTPTPSPTPSPSATPSPTPRLATVSYPYGLNLRAAPDSTSTLLAFLPDGTVVVLLDEIVTVDDVVWQAVEYEGQQGWLLQTFVQPTP